MARIIVLGATGRTGKLVIEQLKARGDDVVGVFRSASHRAQVIAAGVEPVVLDLGTASTTELAAVMTKADAVIFAAGTRENEDNVDQIDRDAAIKAADAALAAGVARYLQISALGTRSGTPEGLDDKMQAYYRAKRAGDQFVMGTALNWTIIEPGELTEDAPSGTIELADHLGHFGSISRGDVAATVVAAIDEPASFRRAFELVSGADPIAQAWEKLRS